MFEKMKEMALSAMENKDIEITENSKLIADLKINSFELIELVCKVESEFNVDIPDKKLNSFVTIKDMMDYILSQK